MDKQSKKRLGEFYDMLTTLKEIVEMLKDLFYDKKGNVLSSLSAARLRQLVGFKRVINIDCDAEMIDKNETGQGLFPDYSPILEEFENMIVWKGYVPQPRKGIFEEFDKIDQKLSQIRHSLKEYVEQVIRQTGCPTVKLIE